MRARLLRLLPLAVPVGATLFLLSGPLLGATTDDEEYRNAIASLLLHARAVLDGEYPFWTSALGFGLPHPLHPTFFFHPLMPLFGLAPVGVAVRALYALHGVLGAYGAWTLVRRVGGGTWTAAIGSATWVLATPALSYSQTDFWPSNFIGWSLAPYLLLCGLRLLEHPAGTQPWVPAVALGATAGFLTVTGHAGQQPALFLPLAALCLCQPRDVWRRLPAFAAATLIGVLIASPVVGRLLMELSRFPDLPRQVVDVPMGWSAAFEMLLRPIESAHLVTMFTDVMAHGTRLPYFGGPMLLLACAYTIRAAGPVRYRAGLVLGFLVPLVLVFLPSDSGPTIVPGTYVFRDPMVLTGTLLGCLALESIWARAPRAAGAIASLQIAVLLLGAYPFIADTWHHGGVSDPSVHRTPMIDALRAWTARLPGRWYLAPSLDELVRRGTLYNEGLWRDTWVYHDLPVVNGLFKGISADTIHPSGTLPLGRIEGHASTVGSAAMLDVMGIGAVLALGDEPVASTLKEVARFDTHLGQPVRLLRNPGAWPGAAFVDAALLGTRPATLDGCPRGLLCLDLSAVRASNADTQVSLHRRHGVLRASFAPAPQARRLLVSEMYRPEWAGTAGGASVPVTSAWNSLIVVEVPAGATAVELRYRPALLMTLTLVSGLTLGGAWLFLAGRWLTRRRAAYREGTDGGS